MHQSFFLFLLLKPIKRGFLSDSEKHKVPQSIQYEDCHFSQGHHKIVQILQFLVVYFFFRIYKNCKNKL